MRITLRWLLTGLLFISAGQAQKRNSSARISFDFASKKADGNPEGRKLPQGPVP
ncbi:MAG TPA: hypothetical protein VKN36_08570 [Eudoraea sp.]|nr:hypothetical protein [Eudoraea sp.]